MDASPNYAKSDPVILLGLGFTTSRVARRLLFRGADTWAAVRGPERFASLRSAGLKVRTIEAAGLPAGAVLVHTVPPGAPELRDFISQTRPRRVVYISSTGVYGEAKTVDISTLAQPSDEKGRARLEEEQWIERGPWASLCLRAAAIYGPGRGVHMRVREGRLARGSGAGVVSRIHVDDLAALVEAGALSDLTGAWPVADEHPCSSEEITRWCAQLLRVQPAGETTDVIATWGRRVDGAAIREALGITLAYPDYQSGILASLAADQLAR